VKPGTVGTVLFIEKDAPLHHVVTEALRKQGFHVYEAPDGRFGLDLFQVREPEIDVILLDVSLPRLSGWEVLSELQRIRPGVKVVLTSTSGPEIVWNALERRED
jgi:two-component system, cell cycle sensor histidine kinase and response regulator CckA